MGEARRRRLHPSPEPTPVEDFRVPDGRIALTLDIEGATPSTCIMEAAMVPDMMAAVGQHMGNLPYKTAIRGLVDLFLAAKRSGDDGPLVPVGRAGLWLALNHPRSGALMRERVSDRLRESGSAHLTLSVIGDRLMLALGPRFVDGARLASLTGNGWIVVAPERGPAGTMH